MGAEALRNRQGAQGWLAAGLFLLAFPGGLSWRIFLADILLTSLSHVNWPEAGITPRRIQNGVLGRFVSKPFALGLTVSHKTVAEVG
jgi:hypothetical protein